MWLTKVVKRVRRIFANVLTEKKCDSYTKTLENEAVATLHSIREQPSAFAQEIHRYSLSVARCIAFGKRVQTHSDPFAVQIQKLSEQFLEAMTPGKYLFESIPSLQLLPRFMQPWLPELEQFRDYEHTYNLENYREALAEAEKYPERPCIARDFKREMIETGDLNEHQAATTCMEVLGAGSDTTANALLFMVLALAAHPYVQERAQEELDRVVGQDRLPTWADEKNLPYIRAIIKEQHRWRTIAPMSKDNQPSSMNVMANYFRLPALV